LALAFTSGWLTRSLGGSTFELVEDSPPDIFAVHFLEYLDQFIRKISDSVFFSSSHAENVFRGTTSLIFVLAVFLSESV